jgi:hypothetical protein
MGDDMRYITLIVLVLAACGSSHPASLESAAPTSYTDANGFACAHANSDGYCPDDPAASKLPVPPTVQASPAGPSCASQVTSWLAEQDGTGITGNTVNHDISAIVFDAKSYQVFGPGNQGSGQTFLNFMTDINYQGIAVSSMDPPSCADPQGYWQAFLNAASAASQDTAGTSQATSDVQSVLSAFDNLNMELANTSGVKAKGYSGTP